MRRMAERLEIMVRSEWLRPISWGWRLFLALPEKIRFILMGGFNVAAAYAVFFVLFLWLGHSTSHLILVMVAHVIGTTISYTTFKCCVFRTKGNILREYAKSWVVSLVNLVMNLALIYILVDVYDLRVLPSQAFILLVIAFLSYMGHKHYSFKSAVGQ